MARKTARRVAACAATVMALGIAHGGDAVHAGSVTIAPGTCARDGARIRWDHTSQAEDDATFGTLRAISILKIETFEPVPRQLRSTEVGYGDWLIEPIGDVGTVTVDITLSEIVTRPDGTWFEHVSTPRTTFMCLEAPPTTTTTTTLAPPTTIASRAAEPVPPTTEAEQISVADPPPPPSNGVVLPTTTVVGSTTEVPIGLLPETGRSLRALVGAGCFMLLAGVSLAAGTRKRPAT